MNLPGKRCLDVGAGAGSITHFLADQVGENGAVTALDINPIHIQPHPRLTIIEHDLTTDTIEGHYDLIHARLVLGHLPDRGPILYRLIQALAPGGYLLIEDWYIPDHTIDDMVITAPSPHAKALYLKLQHAMSTGVFTAAGTDRTWARRVNPLLRAAGLHDVTTTIASSLWQGGRDSGTRLIATSILELHDQLLAAGLAEDELSTGQQLLDNPELLLAGHLLYSTSGQRDASTVEHQA